MAITQAVANSFKGELLTGTHNFTAATGNVFKLALYTSAATLNSATTVYANTNEVANSGQYATGGGVLTNVSPVVSSGVAFIDFSDLSFTGVTLTARGALIYNTSATNKSVCVLDSQTMKKGVNGIVYLEETADKKTRIYGSIRGLRPGLHGFHIHEAGDMTKGCDSACSHYNPYGHNHGGLTSKKRHVGDLGNVEAGKNGVATIDITDRFVKLRGKYSVIGRSLVVHEDEDDLGNGNHDDSLTTGHSGKRLACGVIGYAKI